MVCFLCHTYFCAVLSSCPHSTVRGMVQCYVTKPLRLLKLYSGQPWDLFFEGRVNSTPSALLKVTERWTLYSVTKSVLVTAMFYRVAKP